jgi:hypothetical protein
LNLCGDPPSTYMGMKIMTSIYLTKPYEDWSKVRSPARARRRRHKHRQNIVTIQVPDPTIYKVNGVLHMHPEIYRKLMKEAKEKGVGISD